MKRKRPSGRMAEKGDTKEQAKITFLIKRKEKGAPRSCSITSLAHKNAKRSLCWIRPVA